MKFSTFIGANDKSGEVSKICDPNKHRMGQDMSGPKCWARTLDPGQSLGQSLVQGRGGGEEEDEEETPSS